MANSRESSPDWLRTFQAPTQLITTLSSDSDFSGDKSPLRDDSVDLQTDLKHRKSSLLDGDEDGEKNRDIAKNSHTKKSPNKTTTNKRTKAGDGTPSKRKKTVHHEKEGTEDDEVVKREEVSDKSTETYASAPHDSVYELSSDSELSSIATLRQKEENGDEESVKGKSSKKQIKHENVEHMDNKIPSESLKIAGEVGDLNLAEDGKHEKVSSSTLPLILPDKVHRYKALVECEGESIDLGGDMGAVGRVMISETPSKESEMFIDLKGTIYKTVIVPSRTFCVVCIGQSEAKQIEAIMNDYIQLKPQSNVYDAETMVEGTLEGFTFDSDDEADNMTKEVKGDPGEGAEDQSNKKVKGKAEKKSEKSVATKKKGKDGGKQSKKRKSQSSKGKAKK